MSEHRLVEVRPLKRLEDTRGWLLKVIQQRNLAEQPFGEVYLSVGAAGEIRGSHYHERTTEWFCAFQGRGMLYLWEHGGTRREAVVMDIEQPVSVRVPPGVAHALVAASDGPFGVLAVADVEYDPEDTDTYAVPIESIRGEGADRR